MDGWTARVRAALLSWYDGAARDLPWRRTRDPYRVWVSEVMLQQTRVDTVLRYYDRFMERFPSASALADAPEDDVMAAWSGLGYYRRARLLHAGVRDVVARHAGQVPADPVERQALPGVGRYTAGAIGSIAFDQPEPIVDGNVARVLCRLRAIDAPPTSPAVQRELWEWAERLVRGPRPGALNQALMELGATVCRKQNPHCARCPVQAMCAAYAAGRTAELPLARERPQVRSVAWVGLLAIESSGRLWLQRGAGTLFGGLWNLPMVQGSGRAAVRSLMRSLALSGVLARTSRATVEHVLTHRRMLVELWSVRDAAGAAQDGLRPVALAELDALGISRLTRKALVHLPGAPGEQLTLD